jgi:hypothetical protein
MILQTLTKSILARTPDHHKARHPDAIFYRVPAGADLQAGCGAQYVMGSYREAYDLCPSALLGPRIARAGRPFCEAGTTDPLP